MKSGTDDDSQFHNISSFRILNNITNPTQSITTVLNPVQSLTGYLDKSSVILSL